MAAAATVACLGVMPAGAAQPAGAAIARSGSGIAALASANVGRRACSTNSRGSRGYETSCTGNGGLPEYWCADFAKWVWATAGAAHIGSLDAAAGSFYLYGLEFGTLTAVPAVGDAAVFNYYGGGDAEHVAIVTAVRPNGTIETVSGDWGGHGSTEAGFASTSSVVHNAPWYRGVLGAVPGTMGMTLSGFVAPAGVPVAPVVGRAQIPAGHVIQAGDGLKADGGAWRLVLQSDGNLVELGGGRPVWSTGTEGHPGDEAVLQRNGDFVVATSTGTILWSSHTGGHVGSFQLVLEDTGTLAVLGGQRPLWWHEARASSLGAGATLQPGEELISPNGLYTLQMQPDGNLAEYTAGRALWWTGTQGNPGSRAIMQRQSNLVLYTPTNHPVWASSPGGRHGTFVLQLDDGSGLVIDGPSGQVWSNGL